MAEEIPMTDEEAVAFMDEELPGWREMTSAERKAALGEKLDSLLDLMNDLRPRNS